MNTAKIIEQIRNILWGADENQKLNDTVFLKEQTEILRANLQAISAAFSGSWIGYHANVYYEGFARPAPGDHFSSEWGFRDSRMAPTSSNWQERNPDEVEAAVFEEIAPDYKSTYTEVSRKAAIAYDEEKDSFKSVLAILLEGLSTDALKSIKDEFDNLSDYYTETQVIDAWKPGRFTTRDSLAASQGLRTPPHLRITAWLKAAESPFYALHDLSKLVRRTLKYLELREEFKLPDPSEGGRDIFIGHGRSSLWRELKDFLSDRLRLQWEEFNREPVAGLTTTERLNGMLDSASFAFLIMTAEDEHADSTLHARENVIHEIGLFQGRLGFRRAIVILEEGCSEFSNITGLSQIRFPAGNIAASFEEIRQVLEREGFLSAS